MKILGLGSVVALSILVSSASPAFCDGPAISDPKGILPQLDTYLGQANFARAFHSGDTWSYSQKDCLGQNGDGPCDDMHSDVTVAVQTDATLTSSIDGRPTGVETITRDDWVGHGGSAVRMRIESLNSASYAVVMEKAESSQASVEWTGTRSSSLHSTSR